MKYFLIFIMLGTTAFSQEMYFNKRYDFFNKSDGSLHVFNTDTGYIAIGGAEDSMGWALNLAILFINENGNEVWKKTYGKNGYSYYSGYASGFIKTFDNGYALAGGISDTMGNNSGLLFKFNADCDTLWTKQFNWQYFNAFYQCKQTADTGYILIGAKNSSPSNTNIWLVKTDSLGNFQWEKTYGGSGVEYAFTVELCNDGGYIIGGYTKSFGAGGTDTYIIKTDSAGNVKWSKTYGDIYNDSYPVIFPMSEGNFIVSASVGKFVLSGSYTQMAMHIMKIDSVGGVIFDKEIGPARFGTEPYAIHKLDDGNFVVAAQRANLSGTPTGNGFIEGIVFKVDNNGDSLWYRVYEHNPCEWNMDYLRDLKPTDDGGFIAAGFIVPVPLSCPGDSGNQDMWVIKLDSCGCLTPLCDSVCAGLIIDTVNTKEKENEKDLFIVYPNPASDKLNVQMSNYAVVQIEIYNILGEKVYEMENGKWLMENGTTCLTAVKNTSTINHLPLTIDISHLPRGMYFYQLSTSNGQLHRGKLVVEK